MSKRPAPTMDASPGKSNKAAKLEGDAAQRSDNTAQVGDSKTAKGLNLAWAGNICHPNDTSVVRPVHKCFIHYANTA